MRNVVKIETTKRKLGWEEEAVMRQGKRKGQARRQHQKESRDSKWIDESSE